MGLWRIVAKNIGRTQATKDRCYLAIEKISENNETSGIRRVDSPIDVSEAKIYNIFDDHTLLEPGEEVSDEIALCFDTPAFYKVKASWYSKKFVWSSVYIFRNNQSEN